MEPFKKDATLIVLEGVDGAGKTTLGERVAARIRALGYSVAWHPNQSLLPVRRALNEVAQEYGYSGRYEMLGADTAQLLASVLKYRELLALQEQLTTPGHFIIKDRYIYSWYALANVFGTKNEDLLRRLFRPFPRPDITFLMRISPGTAHQRILKRGIDQNSMSYLERACAAYQNLPETREFFEVVDAEGAPDDVLDQVWRSCVTAIPSLSRPHGTLRGDSPP